MPPEPESIPAIPKPASRKWREVLGLVYVLVVTFCLAVVAWDGWESHRLKTCLVGLAIATPGIMISRRAVDRVFRPERVPVRSNQGLMYLRIEPWVQPFLMVATLAWVIVLIAGRTHREAADTFRLIALVSFLWSTAMSDYIKDRKPLPPVRKPSDPAQPWRAYVKPIQSSHWGEGKTASQDL